MMKILVVCFVLVLIHHVEVIDGEEKPDTMKFTIDKKDGTSEDMVKIVELLLAQNLDIFDDSTENSKRKAINYVASKGADSRTYNSLNLKARPHQVRHRHGLNVPGVDINYQQQINNEQQMNNRKLMKNGHQMNNVQQMNYRKLLNSGSQTGPRQQINNRKHFRKTGPSMKTGHYKKKKGSNPAHKSMVQKRKHAEGSNGSCSCMDPSPARKQINEPTDKQDLISSSKSMDNDHIEQAEPGSSQPYDALSKIKQTYVWPPTSSTESEGEKDPRINVSVNLPDNDAAAKLGEPTDRTASHAPRCFAAVQNKHNNGFEDIPDTPFWNAFVDLIEVPSSEIDSENNKASRDALRQFYNYIIALVEKVQNYCGNPESEE